MKSAIITGPTGAIGMALLKKLTENNVKTYAVVHKASKRKQRLLQFSNVEVIECDLCEMGNLPQLINGKVDAFFHLAWENTFGAQARNNMQSQIKNIGYTIDAVNVSAKLGCKVFVGAGSQAEYGRASGKLMPNTPVFPENGYGMAKLCAGQMSRVEANKHGIRHVWARILSVYGPWDAQGTMVSSVLLKLANGEVPPCTKGEQLWDFLYSEDAAMALIAMAQSGKNNAVYTLGSGIARPLYEYLYEMRDIVEPNGKIGIGQIEYAENQVMHLQADLTQLTNDTGFIPQTNFKTGIEKTVDWMRKVQHL